VQGKNFETEEVNHFPSEKKKVDQDVTASAPSQKSNAEDLTSSYDERNVSEENEDSPLDRQIARIERIEEKHLQDYPEAKEFVETVKNNATEVYEPMDKDLSRGIVLLVLAALLAIPTIVFILKVNKLDNETGETDPEGCAQDMFDIAMYSILAIIFGIGVVLFMSFGTYFLIKGLIKTHKKKTAK
jgi:hypothetical protein